MEKGLTSKQHLNIKYIEIIYSLLGIVNALLHPHYSIILLFIALTYLYLKQEKYAYYYVISFLIIYAIHSFIQAYYFTLMITLYYLIIQCLKLWNQSLHRYLPYIAAMMVMIIELNYIQYKAIYIAILVVFMIDQIFKQQDQYLKTFIMIYGLFIMMIPNLSIFVIVYLLGLIYISDLKLWMLFYGFACLFYQDLTAYLLFYTMIAFFKQQPYYYVMMIATIFFIPKNIISYLLILMAMIIHYFKQNQVANTSVKLNEQTLINRKIQCYSGIFESLANFYEKEQPQVSYLLHNLGKTLDDQSFQLLHMKQEEYIKTCLESYDFKVSMIEVNKQNIKCNIRQIRKVEIEESIKPLLEHLLQKQFQVQYIKYNGYYLGYEFELHYELNYKIESIGDSIGNYEQENGDIYSIFQFRDNYIAMICDGMGNGKKAYECAKLVSSLFQKFIVSGMLCEEAIHSINQLVQSECFSTLDVIFFNPSKEKAYLLKNAACPTYLIRNQELIVLEGNALPIGILENVEVDCKEINMQDNDLLLLVSDGILESEIKRWFKKERRSTLKMEKESLLNVLRKHPRKDDTTFVLTKISKNSIS